MKSVIPIMKFEHYNLLRVKIQGIIQGSRSRGRRSIVEQFERMVQLQFYRSFCSHSGKNKNRRYDNQPSERKWHKRKKKENVHISWHFIFSILNGDELVLHEMYRFPPLIICQTWLRVSEGWIHLLQTYIIHSVNFTFP